MPSEWIPARLGDLLKVQHGWPFKSEHFEPQRSGFPVVVAIGNFRYDGGFRFSETQAKSYNGTYPAEFELSPEEILIVMTCQTSGGEILGVPARVPNDDRVYLHNQRVGRITNISNAVDDRFLYYLFLSSEFKSHLFATASGSKILHTAPSRIEAFKFNLPSLAEQSGIGEILSAIDARLDSLRQMTRSLEVVARAIFKSWFVDFDPVRAKAEGREPEGVDAATAALFPSTFGCSNGEELPASWSQLPVGQLAAIVGGTTPSTKDASNWTDGEHHWATPKDMSKLTSPILLDTERKITNQGLAQIGSGLLPRGTVLLSSRAPIGYLAIAEVPTAVNQGFIAMQAQPNVSNLFLWLWVESAIDTIKSRANGSTFLEVSKSNFRSIPVLMPPNQIMKAFDAILRPLYERMVMNARLVNTLAELRDTLLPRLISGKLRIPDAEKLVASAL